MGWFPTVRTVNVYSSYVGQDIVIRSNGVQYIIKREV